MCFSLSSVPISAITGLGPVIHAAAEEDTVVQLNSTGPWGVNYVNPKDDPRQKTQ